jgi:hypothetical protein
MTFEEELEHLLNKHGLDQAMNTPDFILAEYVVSCLHAWKTALEHRETWRTRRITPQVSAAWLPEPPVKDSA